ncbi:hypothetical protein [Parasphingorhabdus cellanae]|uniref:hypothetical protein n=1 Tax=Parasphingorhabdus cellanae TaxID=2806553 RepID=UPI001FB0D38B|nr:hypothetical protein [Parasphingorhabdus cellanae]
MRLRVAQFQAFDKRFGFGQPDILGLPDKFDRFNLVLAAHRSLGLLHEWIGVGLFGPIVTDGPGKRIMRRRRTFLTRYLMLVAQYILARLQIFGRCR